MTPPGASSRRAPGQAPATTSTRRLAPQDTSTTSGEQLAIPTKVTTPTTWEAGTSSPQQQLWRGRDPLRSWLSPGSVARGGPRRQRRGGMYPCLLPPPAVRFGVVSSRHRTDGASLGDPLRRPRRRGAKRTRPQLPALCPAGPRGEGGSREWHQAVCGRHRGQESLSDLAPDRQHGGLQRPDLRRARTQPAAEEIRLG